MVDATPSHTGVTVNGEVGIGLMVIVAIELLGHDPPETVYELIPVAAIIELVVSPPGAHK
jgi:hypothetical protein